MRHTRTDRSLRALLTPRRFTRRSTTIQDRRDVVHWSGAVGLCLAPVVCALAGCTDSQAAHPSTSGSAAIEACAQAPNWRERLDPSVGAAVRHLQRCAINVEVYPEPIALAVSAEAISKRFQAEAAKRGIEIVSVAEAAQSDRPAPCIEVTINFSPDPNRANTQDFSMVLELSEYVHPVRPQSPVLLAKTFTTKHYGSVPDRQIRECVASVVDALVLEFFSEHGTPTDGR